MREREKREKKTEKKNKRKANSFKILQRKKRRRRRKIIMPLANKEVVHLKTGWEKIQVRDLLFTTLLSKVRSSLSLFFFLSFMCLYVYEEDAATTK